MAYDSNFTPSTSGRDPYINPSPGPGPGPVPVMNSTYIPNYAVRGSGGSEDGGDDSVNGRKVKFLCSFGGKILPRPSDGVLRYVGGQTRIISVRRDVSFGELVGKMVDVCGHAVSIKYQLPFEDLDALVSVSCPDDVENMMEEFQKLLETSPDGSAKLRVFLFSGAEGDSNGLVQFGGLEGSGHSYVDAVNGIVDGFSGGGIGIGITRKESMASAASTQNSDLSGAELLDGAVVGQDNNSVPSSNFTTFSPRAESASPNDNGLRLETSVTPLIVPTPLVPPLSPPTQPVVEIERTVPVQLHGQQQLQGYDWQNTGMNFPPPPSAYLGGYTDPHQQQQLPTQMVYGNHQVVGAPRPVLIQQQYRDNAPMMTQQFIPAVQMTVSPASSPMSMNPGIVQPIVQQPQSYVNAYPPQVSGGYGWQQVTPPPPDHVPYSEGWMPHQHAVPRLADCYMCQKALPHAHSDTIVQDQKTGSDTNPIYQSLQLDDISRTRVVAPSPNQGVMGVASNIQVPYDALHHPPAASSQLIHEPLGSKPVNGDSSPVANVTYQIPQQYNPETSMDYPGRIIRNPDGRPMELIRENFQTKPSDILHGNEQNKSPAQQYMKDDIFEQVIAQSLPNATFTVPSSTPQTIHQFHTGHLDTFEGVHGTPPMVDILPSSNDPRDDAAGFYPGAVVDNVTSIANINTPHDWVGVGNDSSAHSLFSNQDPWNMMAEAHYPPPKPLKITMRRESSAKDLHGGETSLNSETQSSDVIKPTLEQVQTTKGSAEDLIKQQLQATAEGVAASVLHSSVSPNADYLSQETSMPVSEVSHEMSGQTSDANIQTKMEALKIKPEKANVGFPMSDGKGRLQIIKNSDLEELLELGSGTFGTVYHGKWRGTDVAIKRINDRCFAGKTSEQERMRDDFWNEAIKLADLHHPNVVAFYGVVLDGPGGSVATVTEYMTNGSLRTALQKNERNLDKRKRLLITMDVAFGMEYLHSKNIVHFDLKSDNLLVNLRDPHRPICKVGDLGLSKVKCQTLISGGVRGTLPWMAPELLNGSSSLVSEKVDVFSFGIVMWELLTGEEPYADLHYGAIIGGIVSNTLRPAVPENCDPSWRALMERCWSAEPSERPNFTDIANELRSMASKLPSKPQTPVAAATKTNV